MDLDDKEAHMTTSSPAQDSHIDKSFNFFDKLPPFLDHLPDIQTRILHENIQERAQSTIDNDKNVVQCLNCLNVKQNCEDEIQSLKEDIVALHRKIHSLK